MSTRIRIISDGTAGGSRVELPDGTPIPLIRKVTWSVDADTGNAKAILELDNVEIFAEADIEELK